MHYSNIELKKAMSSPPCVYQWELAKFLHIGETTLSRRLRTALEPEILKEYLSAINKIKESK